MPPLTKRRRGGPGYQLDRHTIGNAFVVFPRGKLTGAAQSLAMSLPADPDNDVVVVDLPLDTPISAWDSVADVLPRRRRGVRLLLGGRSRETTALAGQWLSERLRRPVLAPDGIVVRGVAGAVFVHSGQGTSGLGTSGLGGSGLGGSGLGSGWVRFHPGRAPRWEAKRFPRPSWDAAAVESISTSSTGVAEPIPGGVWIHPVHREVPAQRHWTRLAAEMPCRPDAFTVVLGCPGAPPLSLDDVIRFWHSLAEPVREQTRFVHYGPVRMPPGEPLGQVLADVFDEPVRCHPGLPTGSSEKPDVHTVRANGEVGWRTFVGELGYLPRSHSDFDGIPVLHDVRVPIQGPPELAAGRYWYGPDAALEVVQSGLWVRPHDDPRNADAVRAHQWDPDVHLMVFDATDDQVAERMRTLAEDAVARLDPATRARSRLVPATELDRKVVRVNGPAGGELDTVPVPDRSTGDSFGSGDGTGSGPISALVEVVPTVSFKVSEGPATMQEPLQDEAVQAANGTPGDSPGQPAGVAVVERSPLAEPDLTSAGMSPIRIRLESAPNSASANGSTPRQAARTEPAQGPDAAEDAPEPAKPQKAATPVKAARLQPTPAAAATALLSGKGLDQERAWLRRAVSQEFDAMANSIARILSEHPGFQGGDLRSSTDLLTETVAVRLYLAAPGADVDRALRNAENGPHVPLARCAVAGLTRLPSHRGATMFSASPSAEQWRLYDKRRLVTEWGFTHALTEPSADQHGDVDVLVWSMTARRTKLLEPDGDDRVDNRVVFIPGTSFKVLELAEAQPDGTRGRLLLRELAPSEIDDSGRVAVDRISLDELAMTSLRRSVEQWTDGESGGRVGPSARPRFSALPGLA
ncbi:MAG: hypothetical protein ABW215_13750 [Kibdelosporangium sp.]